MNIYLFFNITIFFGFYLYYSMVNKFYYYSIKTINLKSYKKQSADINDLTIHDIKNYYFMLEPFHIYKYNTFYIYGVASTVDSFNIRMMIRNTWGKNIKKYKSVLFFFAAKSRNEYYNSLLTKEEFLFNDIIQFSFYESYFNLTMLSIWMIKWVVMNCNFFF